MELDLNCDLGEGERKTSALMGCITSANIACGGHAGDSSTMAAAVKAAVRCGVKIGAHPGFPNRESFGRVAGEVTAQDFGEIVAAQVKALEIVAKKEEARIHHVKLHGAMYHLAESNVELAETYVATIWRYWPGVVIYSRFGGAVMEVAKKQVEIWPEGFLDRAYRDDGTLVPRGESGAVLNRAEFFERLKLFLLERKVLSIDGTKLNIPARTWCIHSDSPESLLFAAAAKKAFAGIDLTRDGKQALISELSELYETNGGAAEIYTSLG